MNETIENNRITTNVFLIERFLHFRSKFWNLKKYNFENENMWINESFQCELCETKKNSKTLIVVKREIKKYEIDKKLNEKINASDDKRSSKISRFQFNQFKKLNFKNAIIENITNMNEKAYRHRFDFSNIFKNDKKNSISIVLIFSIFKKNSFNKSRSTISQSIRVIKNEHSFFNFEQWIKNINVQIDLKQLLFIISRTRTQLIEIIKFQSNFDRVKSKKIIINNRQIHFANDVKFYYIKNINTNIDKIFLKQKYKKSNDKRFRIARKIKNEKNIEKIVDIKTIMKNKVDLIF